MTTDYHDITLNMFKDIDACAKNAQEEFRNFLFKAEELDWVKSQRDLALSFVEITAISKVLEVGCGNGTMLRKFIELGANSVTGIDKSHYFIQKLSHDFSQYPVALLCADAQNIPLRESSFDVSYCERVLMHCHDPQNVIHEIYRVLKKGGKAVFIEPDITKLIMSPYVPEVTEKLLDYCTTSVAQQSDVGAKIAYFLQKANFNNIKIFPFPLVVRDYKQFTQSWDLFDFIEKMVAAKQLTAIEAQAFKTALNAAIDDNTFFCSGYYFVSIAEK